METLQNTLSTFLLEAYHTMPVSIDRIASLSIGKNATKRNTFFALWRQRSLARRKCDTIKAFHVFANLHLLAMLALAMFFALPRDHQLTYKLVALAEGWLSFFAIDRGMAFLQKQMMPGQKNLKYPQGLFLIAGCNMASRLILVCVLIGLLALGRYTHLAYFIPSGFLLRWLVECLLFKLIQTRLLSGNPKHSNP